jgi:calcineurin-like phosphoesterase
MTGPHHSILGRKIDRVLETTLTFRPTQFQVATGDVRLCGTIVDANPETGRATAIRRIVVRGEPAENGEDSEDS